MLSHPPSLDLVVIGGLTIDRFSDGRTAPGGSVLHSTRAAVAAEGARVGMVTVCGDEPDARIGLQALKDLGIVVRQPAPRTVTFAHHEADGRRVLVLEQAVEPLTAATTSQVPATRVAVLAPIAAELPAAAIAQLRRSAEPAIRVALVQGWLRRLEESRAVEPLAPSELEEPIREELGDVAAAIASTEDLEAVGTDPVAQLLALREAVGPLPVVVLTLGTDGYLLDAPAADRISASYPRRIVRGVPTVGAGDIFGAVMALHLGRGANPQAAAAAAADGVIRILEARAAAGA